MVHVALQCFSESGVEGTSLRQIATKAGTTHAGLLHQFGSKDLLVLEVLAELDRRDAETAAQTVAETTALSGSRAPQLLAMLAQRLADPQMIRLQLELLAAAGRPTHAAHDHEQRRYARLRTIWSNVLRRRAEAGALRTHVDPELAAILTAAVLDGTQAQYALDQNVPLLPAVEHFLELILRPGAQLAEPAASQATQTETPDRSVRDAPISADPDPSAQARILDAARRLFAQRGAAATSITDVAEEAGCSKATVLYHFRSKANLFDASAAPLASDLADLAARLPAERSAVSAVIAVAVGNRALAGLASDVMRGQPPEAGQYTLTASIQNLITAWRQFIHPDMAPLLRFALLGVFAACQSSPDLNDEALTTALQLALENLLTR